MDHDFQKKGPRVIRLSSEKGPAATPFRSKLPLSKGDVNYIPKQERARILSETENSEEQKKKYLQWGAITTIMALIVLAWAFTIKGNIEKVMEKSPPDGKNIDEVADDFKRGIDSISDDVVRLKNFTQELKALQASTSVPSAATSSAQEAEASSTVDEIDFRELERRLDRIEKGIASSSGEGGEPVPGN